MTAEAEPQEEPAESTVQTLDDSLPGNDTPETERCYLTEGELANENELIEAALLARSHKLEDVTITFFAVRSIPTSAGLGQASRPADGG